MPLNRHGLLHAMEAILPDLNARPSGGGDEGVRDRTKMKHELEQAFEKLSGCRSP